MELWVSPSASPGQPGGFDQDYNDGKLAGAIYLVIKSSTLTVAINLTRVTLWRVDLTSSAYNWYFSPAKKIYTAKVYHLFTTAGENNNLKTWRSTLFFPNISSGSDFIPDAVQHPLRTTPDHPTRAVTCLQYPQCDPRVLELRTPPRLVSFWTVLFSSPEDRSDSCAATYQKPPLLYKLPEWNSSAPKKMQLRSCSLLQDISLSPVIPAFSSPFSHSFKLLAIAFISTNS